MQKIGAFDAKTRLSELLDRTAKGEAFEITKHGRPVGRLIPPETVRDAAAQAAAVEWFKNLQGFFGDMTKEEILLLKHEGHKY
jgi:prevent-host-death family protein